MQYASPLPPPSIFLFSHLSVISFLIFFNAFSPRPFLFFARLHSFSFPPLCSFSVDVWRALQSRADGDWSYPGQGPLCGEEGGTGGEERALCLEDGRMVLCLKAGRRGPPIDRLRTRLGCTWELGFSIAGGETGEPGHALACVLFSRRLSQSPLPSCIRSNQGDGKEGKANMLFAVQYLHSVLGLCKVCKSSKHTFIVHRQVSC